MTKKISRKKPTQEKTAKTISANPDRKHARKKRGRKLRQMQSQHIPRPENFDLAGCGVEIYFEHLTFIPDFNDATMTIEYLDKERVCKKCRKRYKIDEAIRARGKHGRKK